MRAEEDRPGDARGSRRHFLEEGSLNLVEQAGLPDTSAADDGERLAAPDARQNFRTLLLSTEKHLPAHRYRVVVRMIPDGLMVAMNSRGRNFLLYSWRDIQAAPPGIP